MIIDLQDDINARIEQLGNSLFERLTFDPSKYSTAAFIQRNLAHLQQDPGSIRLFDLFSKLFRNEILFNNLIDAAYQICWTSFDRQTAFDAYDSLTKIHVSFNEEGYMHFLNNYLFKTSSRPKTSAQRRIDIMNLLNKYRDVCFEAHGNTFRKKNKPYRELKVKNKIYLIDGYEEVVKSINGFLKKDAQARKKGILTMRGEVEQVQWDIKTGLIGSLDKHIFQILMACSNLLRQIASCSYQIEKDFPQGDPVLLILESHILDLWWFLHSNGIRIKDATQGNPKAEAVLTKNVLISLENKTNELSKIEDFGPIFHDLFKIDYAFLEKFRNKEPFINRCKQFFRKNHQTSIQTKYEKIFNTLINKTASLHKLLFKKLAKIDSVQAQRIEKHLVTFQTRTSTSRRPSSVVNVFQEMEQKWFQNDPDSKAFGGYETKDEAIDILETMKELSSLMAHRESKYKNIFIMTKTVGKGGEGEVRIGLKGTSLVALKKPISNAKEIVEKFNKQAELQTKCKHPNIIQCLGWEKDSLCFEYFPGQTYRDYQRNNIMLTQENSAQQLQENERRKYPNITAEELKNKYAWKWKDIRSLMLQAASGIACMEDNNIIHRDIKPANILCIKNGELFVKIADFGSAILEGTQDVLLSVSYPYFLPETFRSFGYVDAYFDNLNPNICYTKGKSDIYNLTQLFIETIIHYNPLDRWENSIMVQLAGRKFFINSGDILKELYTTFFNKNAQISLEKLFPELREQMGPASMRQLEEGIMWGLSYRPQDRPSPRQFIQFIENFFKENSRLLDQYIPVNTNKIVGSEEKSVTVTIFQSDDGLTVMQGEKTVFLEK